MKRHVSAEELAALDLGALKPRKAAKARIHMSACVRCTHLSAQVTAVATVLARASYPAMPESLTARLDSALAAESAQRVASVPATEAGRRDLPQRSRQVRRSHEQTRHGWRRPRLPVLGTRVVAAAGVLAIVGLGGYEIATHATGSPAQTAGSSTGSAAAPSVGRLSHGPAVRYGEPSATKTATVVDSNTNFTAATLGEQATAAVHQAQQSGVLGAQGTGGAAHSANSAESSAGARSVAGPADLPGCLDALVGSQSVLLVENAKFEGKPATIIITAQAGTRSGEVWVVGPTCSASNPDVLDHLRLSRT